MVRIWGEPEVAALVRPFREAVQDLSTFDGVVDKIAAALASSD